MVGDGCIVNQVSYVDHLGAFVPLMYSLEEGRIPRVHPRTVSVSDNKDSCHVKTAQGSGLGVEYCL